MFGHGGNHTNRNKKILDDQKLFGLIGGDHSVSEGAVREMGHRYKGRFGSCI